MTRSFTIPDLLDPQSRIPVGARVRARRCDTHAFIDEEATLDENGQATFTTLPEGVDAVFYTVWHGVVGHGKHRWFFSHIVSVSEGGTGASTVAQARANLGLAIGSDVQAWDDDLDDIAALTPTDGNFIVGDGTNWVAESGATARASLGIGHVSEISIDAGLVTEEVASDNTRAAFDLEGVT
jgi:hypothetical protein